MTHGTNLQHTSNNSHSKEDMVHRISLLSYDPKERVDKTLHQEAFLADNQDEPRTVHTAEGRFITVFVFLALGALQL